MLLLVRQWMLVGFGNSADRLRATLMGHTHFLVETYQL